MACGEFRFPTLGTRAAHRAVLLAIDDRALPLRRNTCSYLARPRGRREPVLTPDRQNLFAPDYVDAYFCGTVLHDAGRFRMWHFGVRIGLEAGPICYAESDDGLYWVKHHLGLISFRNSGRNNNIIPLPAVAAAGVTVIKDEQDPGPQRRYKLVCVREPCAIGTAVSPDGLHWTARPEAPLGSAIEQASFYQYGDLQHVRKGASHGSNHLDAR